MGMKELEKWIDEHPYKTDLAAMGIILGGGFIVRAACARIEKAIIRKKVEKAFEKMPDGTVPQVMVDVGNYDNTGLKFKYDIDEKLTKELKIANVLSDEEDNNMVSRLLPRRKYTLTFNNKEDCINASVYLIIYFKKIMRGTKDAVFIRYSLE